MLSLSPSIFIAKSVCVCVNFKTDKNKNLRLTLSLAHMWNASHAWTMHLTFGRVEKNRFNQGVEMLHSGLYDNMFSPENTKRIHAIYTQGPHLFQFGLYMGSK